MLNVRLETINDINLLIKLRFDYFNAENLELTYDEKSLIYSQLQQFYPAHLNRDFYAAIVDDDSETMVSAAFLSISERPADLSFPTGKVGLILNVLTYPQYRRKGYATEALKVLINEAKKQYLSYLELSASGNGKLLYEKLGSQEFEASPFTKMKLSLL